MTKSVSLLTALTLLIGCTPSDFASQCDGFTELDQQLTCLESGFDLLRVEIEPCRADRDDDERTRDDDSRDRYASDRIRPHDERSRVDEERARDEDERARDEDERTRDEDERTRDEDERARDIRSIYERVRDDVSDRERSETRSRLIRRGLRDGERIARCERSS